MCVCVWEKEWAQGRREVTAGRRLSASHGSLGTDCGEDGQERGVREKERTTGRDTKEEWKRRKQKKRQSFSLFFISGLIWSCFFYVGVILSINVLFFAALWLFNMHNVHLNTCEEDKNTCTLLCTMYAAPAVSLSLIVTLISKMLTAVYIARSILETKPVQRCSSPCRCVFSSVCDCVCPQQKRALFFDT